MAKCIKCGKPIRNNRLICSFCDGYMCGYEKGRADVIGEFKDLGKLYSEIRADAIDEYMNKLCDKCIQTPNECRNLECPFADDGCQIVKTAEQLKEKNK